MAKKKLMLVKDIKEDHIQFREIMRWQKPENFEMIDNYEFEDTMVFDRFEGWTTENFKMISEKDGKEYHMFLTEGEKQLKQGLWDGNKITGRWTFKKQGSAYSIVYLGK